VVAYGLTLRGRKDLAAVVPPGVRAASRTFPARLVRQSWLRMEYPRVERWTGPIDVVHATNYVGPPTKAGEVVSVYDLGFVRYPEFVAADSLDYPELLRRAVRRGAWIHTTSDFVRDEVIETFSVPPERVVRIYPGIPPIEGGDAARGRALAGSDRYVLAVGTIEPRKNYPRLVAAYRQLRGRLGAAAPDLVVVGRTGWAYGDALDLLRETPGIRLVGHAADAELLALYRHAIALAFPSLYEGFGLPLVEAMREGTPALVGSRGALPEVAAGAALEVEAADVDSIAEGLQRLVEDVRLRTRLAGRGRRRAAAFTWQKSAAAALRVLREAAAS
jgi:glycosyltransferase involved in cell wall biosynthesis